MRNPPRYLNNSSKILEPTGVGNAFGLIKENLKSKFPNHDDFGDESWFTMQKANIVSSLGKNKIRGLDGTDEGPGKVGIVRCNPDIARLGDAAGGDSGIYEDKDPTIESMSAEAKKLDLAVIEWLCNVEGKRKSSRMTAKLTAVGNRAMKVPDSAWPRSAGALSSASGLLSRLTGRTQ